MWKSPVRDQQLKQQIALKIGEIAGLIRNNPHESHPGLTNGDQGMLLFNCYHQLFNDSFDASQLIEDKIVGLFSNLQTVQAGIFSSGVSGVLWTLDHLRKEEFVEIEEETFSGISLSLSNSLIRNCRAKNFDYLHGANGIAFYLMSRPEEEARIYFKDWLQSYYDSGIKDQSGISWLTLINAKENIYGNCLGLAHGIPSTILILINLLSQKDYPVAAELLDRSIHYLLQNRNPQGSEIYFPNYIYEGGRVNSPRLGWCYGDLGCAMALYKAGDFLKRPELSALSMEILTHHASLAGDAQAARLIDADFCHGTVGVAHIFSRFYNYTDKEVFRQAAEFYYGRTLTMAHHSDGLAGYSHYHAEGFAKDYSLLEGISGIGLCLISAVSDIEPKWDSCFLLS